MPKIVLQTADGAEAKPIDFTLEGDAFSVRLEDALHEGQVVATGSGEGWISIDGRNVPFYMSRKNDELSIWIDGKVHTVKTIDPGARRGAGAAAGGASGDVKSPMPGTVLKVPVKAGDTVEANQPLVIMESMKMEMTLSAPMAGTVKAVNCAEGQMVDMGAVLVQLEAAQ